MSTEPTILYHYTNAAGLSGILKSKEIWASSYRFMNDSQELDYAFNLIPEAYPRVEHTGLMPSPNTPESSFAEMIRKKKWDYEYDCIFVSSFTAKGNQLSQWRGYAGEHSGYALGFRKDQLTTSENGTQLVKCIYEKSEQLEKVKEYMNRHLPSIQEAYKLPSLAKDKDRHESFRKLQDLVEKAVRGMISLAPTIKHDGFKEEEEWRLIVGPLEHDSDRICYRSSDCYVVPFVKIDYRHVGLPLEHIVVGPGPHQERSAGSLRQMIDKLGFGEVEIATSGVPFRSW